jgi:DUF1680 family protein
LIYCAEGVDNGGSVENIAITINTQLTTERKADIANGVLVIKGKPATSKTGINQTSFTAIPYYAWSHRGPGEMAVWLSRQN